MGQRLRVQLLIPDANGRHHSQGRPLGNVKVGEQAIDLFLLASSKHLGTPILSVAGVELEMCSRDQVRCSGCGKPRVTIIYLHHLKSRLTTKYRRREQRLWSFLETRPASDLERWADQTLDSVVPSTSAGLIDTGFPHDDQTR